MKAYSEHATWNSFLISNGGVQCQTWKGISCYCEINVYFWVEVFLIRSWLKPSPSLRKLVLILFLYDRKLKVIPQFFPIIIPHSRDSSELQDAVHSGLSRSLSVLSSSAFQMLIFSLLLHPFFPRGHENQIKSPLWLKSVTVVTPVSLSITFL